MIHLLEDLYNLSHNTIIELQKKFHGQNLVGPLQQRLEILFKEFHTYISLVIHDSVGSKEKLKNRLSVLYRDMESISEMYVMLQSTDPIDLDIQINTLKKGLKELVPYVVAIYGGYEAKFIVTPQFQRLSGL